MTAINQYPNLFEISNPSLLVPSQERKKLKIERVNVNNHHQAEDYSDEETLDSRHKDSSQEAKGQKTERKSYVKLSKEDSEKLNRNFAKNNYPTSEEMKAMAHKLGVSLLKIENWYKHHRRSLAKKGNFDIKTKKHFNIYELNYLNERFEKNQRPEREEILEISAQISCTELQVKNWFLNKRKKVKSSQEFSCAGKESSEPKFNLSSPGRDRETDIPQFGDVLNPSAQMKILFSIQQANQSEPEIPKLKLVNEYSTPNTIFQILENHKIKNLMAFNQMRPEIPLLNENYLRLLQGSRNSLLPKHNVAYSRSQYPYNNHVNLFGFSSNIIVPKLVPLRNQQYQGFSVNQNFQQQKIHFS